MRNMEGWPNYPRPDFDPLNPLGDSALNASPSSYVLPDDPVGRKLALLQSGEQLPEDQTQIGVGPQTPGQSYLDRLAQTIAEAHFPAASGKNQFLTALLQGTAQGFAGSRMQSLQDREAFNKRIQSAQAQRAQRNLALTDESRKWGHERELKQMEIDAAKAREKPPAPGDTTLVDPVTWQPSNKPNAIPLGQAKRQYEIAHPTKEPSEELELSPEGLAAAARLWATTGEMVPLGNRALQTRKKIIDYAAHNFGSDGEPLDVGGNQATFRADRASLQNLQKSADATQAFSATASKNAKVMLDAMAKIPDTNSPWMNMPIRRVSAKLLGSADMAAFNAARQTVIPEFAKILSNPSMTGQLTDAARKDVEGVASGNYTFNQMVHAIKVLETDAANRTASYQDQINAIKARRKGAPPPKAATWWDQQPPPVRK